jgi:hypothetical protein
MLREPSLWKVAMPDLAGAGQRHNGLNLTAAGVVVLVAPAAAGREFVVADDEPGVGSLSGNVRCTIPVRFS